MTFVIVMVMVTMMTTLFGNDDKTPAFMVSPRDAVSPGKPGRESKGLLLWEGVVGHPKKHQYNCESYAKEDRIQ